MPDAAPITDDGQHNRLSSALRRAHGLLSALPAQSAESSATLDLLERDLLPRTAGGDAYLVCGIVGPNNAGKSALFNSLIGRPLSPSLASGGATRRLLGATSPGVLARLQADPALSRFSLRPVPEDGGTIDAALSPAELPSELLIAPVNGFPEGLLLIDTPDFDSIMRDNRMASESLLAVADLVIVVVTRHSYQNREVVEFLQRWCSHERPWMVVYNEAPSPEVAREHVGKLAMDLGSPPIGAFYASLDLDVQKGTAPLEARSLGDDEAADQPALRTILHDLDRIADLKLRAFEAAMGRLTDLLGNLSGTVRARSDTLEEILACANAHARASGVQVASAAMPGGPFIEAFREVLDERSNRISRSWRSLLRGVRVRLEALPSMFRRSDAERELSLTTVEDAALEDAWPLYWEEVARDLGPEARNLGRSEAPEEVAEWLDADVEAGRSASALAEVRALMKDRPANVESFRDACRKLVSEALDERGFDLDIQAAADLATLAPLALAAVVIVNTSGLGADIAAAGGGALSTYLAEKYAHLLGSRIMADARRSWAQIRGEQIGALYVEASFVNSLPRLREAIDRDDGVLEAVARIESELRTASSKQLAAPPAHPALPAPDTQRSEAS